MPAIKAETSTNRAKNAIGCAGTYNGMLVVTL